MKKFFVLIESVLLISCSTVKYTQVVTLASDQLTANEYKALYYENDAVRITYDFSDNSFCFLIENRTNDDIEVDFARSFFCVNGIAFDYYRDKMSASWSSTTNTSRSGNVSVSGNSSTSAFLNSHAVSDGNVSSLSYLRDTYSSASVYAYGRESTSTHSGGHAASYRERPISIIPGGVGKIFCEFPVFSRRFTSDDLVEAPYYEPSSIHFNDHNASPYLFINRIMLVHNGQDMPIRNEFYISGITNVRTSTMQEPVYEEKTYGDGYVEKFKISDGVNKYKAPYNAFIEYKK